MGGTSSSGPGATAKEISEGVGLPQVTTYRILNLLVAEEYLVRLPDLSGFALGRRAWPPAAGHAEHGRARRRRTHAHADPVGRAPGVDLLARQCGEVRDDRGCIALPVRAPDDGRLVAGLALAGPVARVAEPNTELVAVAREHANRLAPLLA